ncbi:MAG: SpoVG family protein [Archaeoglobaceae archaeon]
MAEVTDVRIFEFSGSGSGQQKAFADVVLDDEYAIHGLKVMEGNDGPWVAMPSRYDRKNDTYRDVFHPISKEAREKLFNAVLEKYKNKDQT